MGTLPEPVLAVNSPVPLCDTQASRALALPGHSWLLGEVFGLVSQDLEFLEAALRHPEGPRYLGSTWEVCIALKGGRMRR